MRGQALIAATALAAATLMGALPAAAQQYNTYGDAYAARQRCEVARRDHTIGGVILGGIAGAVLGHNVAGGHGSRDEGTALGAVVGGVAGGAIGRNTAPQCAPPDDQAYDPQTGQAYNQYGPDDQYAQQDDLYGAPDDPYGKPDEDYGYGSK